MSDEQLKPCPFCGDPAEMDTRQSFRALSDGRMHTAVAIYCSTCPVNLSLARVDIPQYDEEQLIALAVEAWNKRPSRPAPDEWKLVPDLLVALDAMMTVQSKRRHPLGAPDEGIAYAAADAMSKARAAIARAIEP